MIRIMGKKPDATWRICHFIPIFFITRIEVSLRSSGYYSYAFVVKKKTAYVLYCFFRHSHLSGKLNSKLSSAIIRIIGESLMPHGEFVIACLFLSEAAQDQAA